MAAAKPTSTNLSQIQLIPYNLTLGGTTLGYTDVGTLEVEINGKIISKGVDQIAADIAIAIHKGWSVIVRATLSAADPDFIATTLFENLVTPVVSGSKVSYSFNDHNVNLFDIAKDLYVVPADNSATDLSKSFYWGKVYQSGPITFQGNKDEFQSIPVEFTILPDPNATSEAGQYGRMGDVSIAASTNPDGVFITTGDAVEPYISASAADMAVGEKQDVQAWAANLVDSGVTALVNGAYTAGDGVVNYDTLSSGSSIGVGKYIKIGSSIYYVYADTGSAASIRIEVAGTADANHADNAAITIGSSLKVVRVTNFATWASSDDTKATVGNTINAFNDSKRGRIVGVAAGPTNVDATFPAGGTTSLDYVVTVA